MIGLPGVDGITVTVSVTGPENRLRALRFTRLSNAVVTDLDGGPHSQPYVLTFPAGREPTRFTFTLWRTQAPTSMARLVAVDGCDDWPTFVGRGRG